MIVEIEWTYTGRNVREYFQTSKQHLFVHPHQYLAWQQIFAHICQEKHTILSLGSLVPYVLHVINHERCKITLEDNGAPLQEAMHNLPPMYPLMTGACSRQGKHRVMGDKSSHHGPVDALDSSHTWLTNEQPQFIMSSFGSFRGFVKLASHCRLWLGHRVRL